MNNYVTFSSTTVGNSVKYDEITDEFLRWVRHVPLESDAVANIPRILKRYEDKKSIGKIFKQLIRRLLSS